MRSLKACDLRSQVNLFLKSVNGKKCALYPQLVFVLHVGFTTVWTAEIKESCKDATPLTLSYIVM